MAKQATVTKELIDNGPGFKPDVRWFVDCDGYALGVFDTEDSARSQCAYVNSAMELGRTPRELSGN